MRPRYRSAATTCRSEPRNLAALLAPYAVSNSFCAFFQCRNAALSRVVRSIAMLAASAFTDCGPRRPSFDKIEYWVERRPSATGGGHKPALPAGLPAAAPSNDRGSRRVPMSYAWPTFSNRRICTLSNGYIDTNRSKCVCAYYKLRQLPSCPVHARAAPQPS